MSKHTKGPWKAGVLVKVGISMASRDIKLDKRNHAKVYGAGNETTEANAQLIAAAPDLLEALELAESILKKIPYKHISKAHASSSIACNTAPESFIRAAIAKARGES